MAENTIPVFPKTIYTNAVSIVADTLTSVAVGEGADAAGSGARIDRIMVNSASNCTIDLYVTNGVVNSYRGQVSIVANDAAIDLLSTLDAPAQYLATAASIQVQATAACTVCAEGGIY